MCYPEQSITWPLRLEGSLLWPVGTLGRALASMTRSPFVPLTLQSGSRTPHRASRSDIAAVPTGWKTLHSVNDVRISGREPIQGLYVRRRVVPCVLDELLIRTRRSRLFPRTNNKPLPGFSSDESLTSFEGGNYRFDVEVGGQEIGIDDGRIKRIRTP